MIAVHVVTALLFFCGAFLLSRIFKEFGRASTGRWAAVFYVFGAAGFIPKYLATSINSVMVFFLIVSAWGIAKSVEVLKCLSLEVGDQNITSLRKHFHLYWIVFSGLMFGVAFLFKYTAGIQLGLLPIFSIVLFLTLPREKRTMSPAMSLIVANGLFFLAFLVPFALHSLYLKHLGVWQDFVLWSFSGSSKYIQQGQSTIVFWKSLLLRFGGYVGATVYLWIAAARALRPRGRKDLVGLFFLVWFCLSLVPVCVGGRFYGHYFLHLLPALCGLAALGYELFSSRWKQVLVGLMMTGAVVFFFLRADFNRYEKWVPDDQLSLQKEIGERLKDIAKPGEKLFVWGFATTIYFYSDLTPASRFLWTDLLTGRTPGPEFARVNREQEYRYANPIAWGMFWEDLHKNEPEYFVDTAPANIHGYKRFTLDRYPELWGYLQENYEKVKTVEGVEIYRRK
jgi:4-amino-4-deoxy-L-arabinose transferase-like glycosyltransferase